MHALVTAIMVALLLQAPATLNPQWGTVLPDDQARTFATARLCNRPAPGPADAIWAPDADTVRRLESVLAAELQTAIDLHSDPNRRLPATDFYRQYAGLVIAGKRIVYINGLHKTTVERDPKEFWKTRVSRSCDGGLLFFGAEYDVATGTISKILFNGGGRGARPWHKGSPRGEAMPPDLSALLSRTPYEGRIETWCRGTFGNGEAPGFAMTLVTAKGRIYAAVRGDAQIMTLADVSGRAGLACHSRSEAEKLDATIRTSATIEGSLTPKWDSTVICGFVRDTEAVCWQYSPQERKYVRVGGWIT